MMNRIKRIALRAAQAVAALVAAIVAVALAAVYGAGDLVASAFPAVTAVAIIIGLLVLWGYRLRREAPDAPLTIAAASWMRQPLRTRALAAGAAATVAWFASSTGHTVVGVGLGVLIGYGAVIRVPYARMRTYMRRIDGLTADLQARLAGLMPWPARPDGASPVQVGRIEIGDDGGPERFALAIPSGFSSAGEPGVNHELARRLSDMGSYVCDWALGERLVYVRRVTPLATRVAYDGRAAEGWRVWMGVGVASPQLVEMRPDLGLAVGDTTDVYWNLETCPHGLYSGGTGSGKSVAINLLLNQVLRAGWRVLLADPKRVELSAYRGKAGVVRVATELHEIAEMIHMLRLEMEARYARMEEAGVRNVDDLPTAERPARILLVVDEAIELLAPEPKSDDPAAQQRATDRAQAGADLTALGRLARACGIRILLATQRPDVSEGIRGSLKNNLEWRGLMGASGDTTARGMAGFAGTTVAATPGVRGRGLFGRANTIPFETQVGYAGDEWIADLPDAVAPGPVDADGDGVITVTEAYNAADGEAGRLAVLEAALAAGTLTDADAAKCGYEDVAAVKGVLDGLRRARARTAHIVAAEYIPEPGVEFTNAGAVEAASDEEAHEFLKDFTA